MSITTDLRDPWVAGGLALLAALSLLAVLLYRGAPQSVAEARTRAWLAARPDAFAPRLAQARERLEAGLAAREGGRDSVAVSALEQAAEQAWTARELAEREEQAAEATALWAEATLAGAEILLELGTGAGLRPDDNEVLRNALSLVEQVRTRPVAPPLRERAEALEARVRRQLRPGPLEWLPRR